MLCRTSTIRHPGSDVCLKTPLLVPSFSSKGFSTPAGKHGSDVNKLLTTAAEFLTDTFLVSAYDIHHEHVPKPAAIPCKTDLVFLDSGGYEASVDVGYSAVYQSPYTPKPWTTKNLEGILEQWPHEIPAVFVSFDHPKIRKPLCQQIAEARMLFRQHRDHLRLLLIKPEKETQRTLKKAIASATADVEALGTFDIVGVTEKELGRTMLDRMSGIARLRLAMDEADVQTPLHIFGALDPLTVCLYYISGAEIFDGLSWLRYGYKDGLCVYTHNVGAIDYGLHFSDDDVRTRAFTNNYYHLQELRQQLLKLEATRDPERLEFHGATIAKAIDSMKTRFRRAF